MAAQADIQKLNDSYYETEGENKAACVEKLAMLHKIALKKEKDETAFRHEAAQACGGCFIGHLFWKALADFYENEENRTVLFELIEAFINSDFEADDLLHIKPLLAIYFSKEKVFEVDRVNNRLVKNAHPEVQDFFTKIESFGEVNPSALKAYQTKFAMLKDQYPDFELFELPIPELEERLGAS